MKISLRMPKTRQNKCNSQDANTNPLLDVPSTSTQTPPKTSSRRRASPFRGFDGNIDHTGLAVMNRILSAQIGGGGSCGEVLKDVKKKRKRPSSPESSKTKQIKTKVSDFKSTDLMKKLQAKSNNDKKKSQSRSNKKEKTVYTDENVSDNATNREKRDFLGYESKEGNFVNIFNNLQRGLFKPSVFDEIGEQVALKSLRWFKVFVKHETSDLRVTAMAWHPSNPHLLVSGGKAGTLVLYKIDEEKTFNSLNQLKEIPGMGPGGTMENIKFNTKRSGLEVCTASVDGTISCYNFDTETRKTLVGSVNPCRLWFCAVDIHQDGKSVYGADCMGNLAIHHLDCGKTEYGPMPQQLHKGKIRHLEFSPRDPNVMVTSSLDRTVKVWDIRKLDGIKSYIDCLEHDCGVVAAKFSRRDGCRLLTTDLQSELRVYKAPLWNLEHNIIHPHRHFQHLTIIRASWHPRADLFVVGRYPNPKVKSMHDNLRSVDIYSASSAKLCYELTDTSKLITSLSEFNSTGSFLASSAGRTLFVWKQRN